MTVGDVAERTFLLGPSLSRIVARLEDRGLIERAVAAEDNRRGMLALSPFGRDLVGRVAPHSEATYAEIERAFGRQRLDDLMSELSELARVVAEVKIEPDTSGGGEGAERR